MAFARVTIVLATLFLLQPLTARSDFLSPIFDDVRKEVECGKGTCKASKNTTFFFECECEPGWKQAFVSSDEKNGLKFLPCLIPNCSLNDSCFRAPSPAQAQEKVKQANESIFDACHWVDCGGGSCNKASTFSYSCECDAGYINLLNITALPCYGECDIGMDCSALGLSMTNSSTSPPSTLNDNSNNNKASSILHGSCLWLVMLILIMMEILLQ